MAVKQEQEAQPRRRSRPRTYGWFDHGEKLLFHSRYADRPAKPTAWTPCPTKHKLERHLPTIRFILLLITRILATIAILGPAIIVSTTTLRSVQLLCQHRILSQNGTLCNNTWTKPQQSVLFNLPPNKTPMTTALAELEALNTLSPSLGFLGLPLFHANLNLSTVLADLEDSLPKTTQLDITIAGARGHEFAELFSSKEADFRRVSSTWDEHGTVELQGAVHEITQTLRSHFGWLSATRESFFHVVPFLPKYSLSYKLLVQYHDFVSTQQSVLREVVMDAIETRLLLEGFLDELGRFETQLGIVGSGFVEDLDTIRLGTAWALQVTRLAEEHYKIMYGSIHSWFAPLADDVASYDSWWLSRNVMPLPRLRGIVDVEGRQLGKLHAQAERAEEDLERLYEEFMTGGEGAVAIGDKVNAAAREGRVDWV